MKNDDEQERIMTTILEPIKDHLDPLASLITLKGSTLVIGDLHADLLTLTRVIRMFKAKDYSNILFLGDYIDRGKDNIATMNTLLELQLEEPSRVHLLRGNHETRWVNKRQGLFDELKDQGMLGMHSIYNELFSLLPLAAVMDGKVFGVHGGIPEGDVTLDQIRDLDRKVQDPNPSDKVLMGLLWNDPDEDIDGFAPNVRRGYMTIFGRGAFDRFMEGNHLEKMVRGHQKWNKGYRYFFDGKLVSIYSSKSYKRPIDTKALVVDDGNIELVGL